MKGFVLLPRRWVAERTFSWLGRNRRLAKDWENLATTLQTFAVLVSIQITVRRLARKLLSQLLRLDDNRPCAKLIRGTVETIAVAFISRFAVPCEPGLSLINAPFPPSGARSNPA